VLWISVVLAGLSVPALLLCLVLELLLEDAFWRDSRREPARCEIHAHRLHQGSLLHPLVVVYQVGYVDVVGTTLQRLHGGCRNILLRVWLGGRRLGDACWGEVGLLPGHHLGVQVLAECWMRQALLPRIRRHTHALFHGLVLPHLSCLVHRKASLGSVRKPVLGFGFRALLRLLLLLLSAAPLGLLRGLCGVLSVFHVRASEVGQVKQSFGHFLLLF